MSISADRTAGTLDPAWMQAHGHAQIFGWIGAFILGIGFYSLSKMGRLLSSAVSWDWLTWALWTGGVFIRWVTNVYQWHWRILLPGSAMLELTGFLIFFRTVRAHKTGEVRSPVESWMRLVIASTIGFGLALILNAGVVVWLSAQGGSPAVPHAFDQRFLVLLAWGFLVPAVWGFNARWLPVFLGLEKPLDRGLLAALGISASAVGASFAGWLGGAAGPNRVPDVVGHRRQYRERERSCGQNPHGEV